MRVLFDSNVILDVFLERKPQSISSTKAIQEALKNGHFCYVSGSCVADIYYILRKALKSKEKALETMKNVLSVFLVAAIDQKTINYAVALGGKDFEDDIITAAAMNGKMECIVTNNVSDFDQKECTAYSPDGFVSFLEKGGNLF